MKHFGYFDYAQYKFAQYKQKGFAPIIIILGVLVIAGMLGGAYYFGKSKAEKLGALPSPTSVVTPQISVSPTPQSIKVDETANWKTYTNDYWKFQFRYPPTWSFLPGYKATDTSFDIINFDYEANRPQTQEESLSQIPIKVPPEFKIAIQIYPNYTKSEQLIEEFEQPKRKEKFNISSMKQFQINSHPVVEYNLTSSITNIPMVDTIIESNQGYIIKFRYWKEADNIQETPNYYKILSTFKFTN